MHGLPVVSFLSLDNQYEFDLLILWLENQTNMSQLLIWNCLQNVDWIHETLNVRHLPAYSISNVYIINISFKVWFGENLSNLQSIWSPRVKYCKYFETVIFKNFFLLKDLNSDFKINDLISYNHFRYVWLFSDDWMMSTINTG